MRIYEPCGKFNLTNKTAEARTYLPTSPQNYRYIRYYNISTSQHYGILGVLVHDGQNRDLRTSNDPCQKIHVTPQTINLLSGLDNSFSSRPFNNLTSHDQIVFICFHDDEFDGEANSILTHYQQNLGNYPIIPPYPKVNKGLGDEPKIGDGGILTFNGSCI